MNNFTLKNLLLEDNFDDESTNVSWINKSTPPKIDDDNNDDNNIVIETETSNFNMNIIKDDKNIKKVRITLEFNIKINDEKSKLISIDMDINKSMILKIAEDLKN
jgi:hypothetical protein